LIQKAESFDGTGALSCRRRATIRPLTRCPSDTMEGHMLKFIGGTVGFIFLVGLVVVIGILMLIF